MRSFIGTHEVLSDEDFVELALGTPLALWLGEENESEGERAARLDAARDILADDPELFDRVSRAVVLTLVRCWSNVAVLPGAVRQTRKAVAA